MKREIPILFSTPMVQAIISGNKTQTRRIVKPQYPIVCGKDGKAFMSHNPIIYDNGDTAWTAAFRTEENGRNFHVKCPYGQPGNVVLWVRETWRQIYNENDSISGYDWSNPIYQYKADNPEAVYQDDGDGSIAINKDGTERMLPWKPSIFMPRAACRIFLKVTNVRVERLQDISEEDAIAEGVESLTPNSPYPVYQDYRREKGQWVATAWASFQTLWQSINGEESWNNNPLVWCITFEKINYAKSEN